jgi:hypothetical protein
MDIPSRSAASAITRRRPFTYSQIRFRQTSRFVATGRLSF